MGNYLLLILVGLFFFVVLTIATLTVRYWGVIAWTMMPQFLCGVVLAPADGGAWVPHMLFFYGSFDALCWLFRREAAPFVEQQTEQGFVIRLLLLTSPVWFAIVYTAIRTGTG